MECLVECEYFFPRAVFKVQSPNAKTKNSDPGRCALSFKSFSVKVARRP